MIETVEKQMQDVFSKQAKLAARKRHYYAIACMVAVQMDNLVDLNAAKEGMAARMREEGDECVSKEMAQAMVSKFLLTLTPLYQMCLSLQSYNQAFGEYPEWTKFLSSVGSGFRKHALENWIDSVLAIFEEVNKNIGKNGAGKLLKSTAFGEGFQKACEAIKLKGEQ